MGSVMKTQSRTKVMKKSKTWTPVSEGRRSRKPSHPWLASPMTRTNSSAPLTCMRSKFCWRECSRTAWVRAFSQSQTRLTISSPACDDAGAPATTPAVTSVSSMRSTGTMRPSFWSRSMTHALHPGGDSAAS